MKRLKHGLKSFFIILLVSLSCWYVSPCSVGQCSEATYVITETQLTTLENNLTELKKQNQILQEQLTQSKIQLENSKKELTELKTQSTTLKKQVQDLTTSLESAKASLNKLETKDNDNYSIGIGVGNDGLAITGDIDKTWIFVDKDDVIVGYKVRF